GAIHSFARARAQMRGDVGPPLFAISLISGWEFDDLDIPTRQHLCEALSLLEMVTTLDEKVYKTVLITKWTPIPLLREWAKATLFVVPRFTTYVALCGHLESIDRITDAVECFYDMTSELGGDFMFTCLTAVTRAATLSAFTQPHANMSTIHTTLPPLLREWAKAKLTRGSWKDALLSAVGVSISFCCPYELGIEIVGLQFTRSWGRRH
ncbi:hypothetical protein EV363DRAFT_1341473, partial [Boletus edulis]